MGFFNKNLIPWVAAGAICGPGILWTALTPLSFSLMDEARFALMKRESFSKSLTSEIELRRGLGRLTPASSLLTVSIATLSPGKPSPLSFRIFRWLEVWVLLSLAGVLLSIATPSLSGFSLFVLCAGMSAFLLRPLVLSIFNLSLNELEGLILCLWFLVLPAASWLGFLLPLLKEPLGLLIFPAIAFPILRNRNRWKRTILMGTPVALLMAIQFKFKAGYSDSYSISRVGFDFQSIVLSLGDFVSAKLGLKGGMAWLLIPILVSLGLLIRRAKPNFTDVKLPLVLAITSVMYGAIIFPWAGTAFGSYYYMPCIVLGSLTMVMVVAQVLHQTLKIGPALIGSALLAMGFFTAYPKIGNELKKSADYLALSKKMGEIQGILVASTNPEAAERFAQNEAVLFTGENRRDFATISLTQWDDPALIAILSSPKHPPGVVLLRDFMGPKLKSLLEEKYVSIEEFSEYLLAHGEQK